MSTAHLDTIGMVCDAKLDKSFPFIFSSYQNLYQSLYKYTQIAIIYAKISPLILTTLHLNKNSKLTLYHRIMVIIIRRLSGKWLPDSWKPEIYGAGN